MERIKQALERARQERETDDGAGKVEPPNNTVIAPGIQRRVAYTNTRVVPVAPAVLKRNKIIGGINDDSIVTAYNMLRTQVLQRLQEQGWNSLAIVSANKGEGKTLTAINLAISMAREVDKTVLLVDLDLRNPSICHHFDYEPDFGVADYLLTEIPLQKMLFNPGIERLVVLPGIRSVLNSAELLASAKMAQLVEELKTRYPSRIVLFDLPPLLSAADALAFAPYVEAALLVVADGETTKNAVKDALQLLKITNVLGTVLNRQMGTS
jgi:capsular exopolysaccharide synthesis family protein